MRRLPVLLTSALLALAPLSVSAQPAGDWGVQRDPFDKAVIGRYKAILARDPHDPSALAKLLELYRRYRTVDLLKEEYQKQLDKKADEWSALVVMGRLHHATGDDPRALDLFSKATAVKDDDAQSWIAIGEIDKAAGKNKDARAAYDKALAHSSAKDMKKKALRALADLALATGDNPGADAYFKQFLDLDPTNAQLWIERGDAMLTAGKRDIALESYAAAEKLLGSDPARRVEVVARRGQALEGMGKDDEAVVEYRRAIKLAPKGYYLEVELTGRVIDIYRRKQALPQLLAQYEKDWPEGGRGHFEWDTLGKLYEETGAQDKAIAALKKAVAKSAWELETQRRLIQLLENSGRDAEALAQYEAVVRAAPGEARFQLELAERYWRRGEEKKALDSLTRLETRFPTDAGVLSAVADLYTRWGKEDLAIAEYERLSKLEPDDPMHLVTLGEQYYQKGDKTRATAVWKKISNSGKASAFAKLADVYAEHNYTTDALANYAEAIKRDAKNPEYYKGRAAVFESLKSYQTANDDWEKVLSLIGTKPTDRLARRDARRHQVQLLVRWGNSSGSKEIEYREKWKKAFKANDPEAGYFLVEYYNRKGQGGEPRATLEKLATLVPDDQDVVLDLVKSYRASRKYDEAVALLLQLAKMAPSREREVFQQISEIKTEARKDDEAIEWAQKALAKSPGDPTAYERLGERYVEMQRFPEAIAAYEKTVQLDARNSKAAFALAQLYVQSGTPMKATELLRNVVRTDTNEDVVSRAGREAIDLEEMTDTLGELEKVLSPLSFMMAHKPVYRRVLVDLYARYVPRLVERVRHGNDEVKHAARSELDRIGAHGLRPLLEALRDEKDPTQQRSAVQVLGHLGNKGAAAPLVHMARQEPPKDQRHHGTLPENLDRDARVDALVAAGRLGDAAVIDDVLPLMENVEVSMREAATFTIGRSGNRRAIAPLLKALGDRRASVQTLACLGLAQIDDPRVGPALIDELKDKSRDGKARAACAYAIGARRIAAGVPALLSALEDGSDAQRIAGWALGQLGEQKALGPLIRAYFSRAGKSADELVWAIGRVSGAGLAPSPLLDLGEYPLRAGKFDHEEAVKDLPGALPHPPAAGKLVVDHATDIALGLSEALSEYRDRVVSVLADLDAAPDRIALGALTPATGDPKTIAALQLIADKIEPKVAAQLAADDPKVRALAISVMAKLDGGKTHQVDAAIIKALGDPADQVRAVAMASIAVVAKHRGTAPPELVSALVKVLQSGAWADRRGAALALGKLGPSADVPALVKAAGDSSSFVREAVAIALVQIGGPQVTEPLTTLSHDEVPQVRDAALKH
jgi:tetratricopeptide (TPR) repeat protein